MKEKQKQRLKLSDLILNKQTIETPLIIITGRPNTGKSLVSAIIAHEASDNSFVIYIDSEGNLKWKLPDNVLYLDPTHLPAKAYLRELYFEALIDTISSLVSDCFDAGKASEDFGDYKLTCNKREGGKLALGFNGIEVVTNRIVIIIDTITTLLSTRQQEHGEQDVGIERVKLINKLIETLRQLNLDYNIMAYTIAVCHARSSVYLMLKAQRVMSKIERQIEKPLPMAMNLQPHELALIFEPRGEYLFYLSKEAYMTEVKEVNQRYIQIGLYVIRSRLYRPGAEIATITYKRQLDHVQVKVNVETITQGRHDIKITYE